MILILKVFLNKDDFFAKALTVIFPIGRLIDIIESSPARDIPHQDLLKFPFFNPSEKLKKTIPASHPSSRGLVGENLDDLHFIFLCIFPYDLLLDIREFSCRDIGLSHRILRLGLSTVRTCCLNQTTKVAKVMGHRDTDMIIKVYGKYIEDAGGNKDGHGLNASYQGMMGIKE